jgi:2',3'-cyclic-nucleotide 2'-phosphodiesterase (5'-nucleotidase family)
MQDHTFADRHPGRAGARRLSLVMLLVGALTMALLPASGVTAALADGHDFPDLSEDNPHRDNVLRLSADGVIRGFGDGTFRPFRAVTRGQFATYLAGVAGLDEASAPYDFPDIDGSVHAGNIQALYDAGVISGFGDGTYRPSATINRDQTASVLAGWLDVQGIVDGPFEDVSEDSVHAPNVNALYDLGIINGTTPTTYAPRGMLQRDQAASLVVASSDVLDEVDLTLTVLHINDGESALLPDESAGFPGAARFVADLLERRDAVTDEAAGRVSVTISAGDNFLAGPRLNASFDEDAEAFYDALIYTRAEFDAMTVGNHEFDFGPDVLADFIEASGDIPFISANLDVTGEPRLEALEAEGRLAASTVVTRGGHDIGIVGATYEGLESISSPRNATTGPVLGAVQDEVDDLTADGVDIIILSSHLQDLDTEISLVPQLSDIDAVVGGGGGEALGDDYPVRVEDADGQVVPVVTVPGNYTDIGQLVLNVDADGDLVYVGSGGLIPVPLDGPRDEFIDQNVEQPVAEFVAELAETEVATTEVPLDGRRGEDTRGVRSRETNLGSLLADSMIYSATERAAEYDVPEADVALQNGGGIRNDGVIPPGPVTELDTFNVAAFVNLVSVAEMDGETLHSALERSVSSLPGASGAHGQWGGVRFTYDTDQPAQERDLDAGEVVSEGERIVDAVVTRSDGTDVVLVDDGDLVAGEDMFTMASIDFLLSGQDGYVMFGDLDFTRVGLTYQASLSEYMAELGTITEADYPDVTVDNDTHTRFGPVGDFSID